MAFFMRLVRDVQAAVLGRPQGHDLHDGDGNVRPGRRGVDSASRLRGSAADDEIDGLLQHRLDVLVAGHAPELGQGEGGHAVAVHVAAARADQVAILAAAESRKRVPLAISGPYAPGRGDGPATGTPAGRTP